MSRDVYKQTIQSFKGKNILIIGDVMLDAYYIGKVTRVSPEAPVPIVNLTTKEDRLGGAANVALNIQALGANAILCGAIGNDHAGQRFLSILEDHNLNQNGILQLDHRPTTVKSRIIGNQQQLVRLDEEVTADFNDPQSNAFIEHLEKIVNQYEIDGIVLEDYDKGLLTPKVIAHIVKWGNKNEIATAVDPKKKHFFDYQNVTIFKPNLKELKDGLEIEVDPTDHENFVNAVKKLESQLNNQISLVTLSEHGIFIKKDQSHFFIGAHKRNITDVSGAGDTVIAVALLAHTTHANIKTIAALSNLAGGLACEQSGVVPVTYNQLLIEIEKLNA